MAKYKKGDVLLIPNVFEGEKVSIVYVQKVNKEDYLLERLTGFQLDRVNMWNCPKNHAHREFKYLGKNKDLVKVLYE